MNTIINQFVAYGPTLLAALAILIVGWLVALVISRLVGSILQRTKLDDRLAGLMSRGGQQTNALTVERWITAGVFWLIMLFVIVAFLQQLSLTIVSQPLNLFLSQVLSFIPGLIGAAILLVVAWIVATFLRTIVVRLLSASGLFRQVSSQASVQEKDRITVAQSIGNIVYWLVFLLFLPAILGALNLQGILAPV